MEAAADLVRRELVSRVEDDTDTSRGTVALARHFAEHRSFYRAMLTGACAFDMTRTLNALFVTLNQNVLRELLGGMEETAARDMALFLAGGVGAVVNDWLIEGAEPLDPEELAGRLLHLESALASMPRIRDDGESTR